MTTALVPLRDGVSGKSRLAAVLDAGSRRRLVRVLARHVVSTLLAADGIERVVVVTADPVFTRETLAGLAVEVLEQPADRPGLNGALEHAREVLAADGTAGGTAADGTAGGSAADGTAAGAAGSRLLVAHADLPALTRQDVTALLAETAPVVIATDRYRSGTNLLLVPFEGGVSSLSAVAKARNPALEGEGGFRFRFGVGSLAAHLDEAAAHGLAATVVDRPGTAVDLDTADDWSQLPDEVRAAVRHEVPELL
ncbi:NTP transferase domain-containing protein [Promicromonospora sukumoe]|uniref:NTP transferase domain-containing protein n=1 Tax=Promicromonospora sukumoe TaxID=88382 RepID=UPI0003611588|nr:NTP transferase domain-containing protein [Promicromonospora sukumoe]